MKKTYVYAIIAVAIIAALLVYAFQDRIVAQFQKDTITTAIVVEYEDGSEQRFEQPALSLVPLTIKDGSGKVVKSVRAELYATVDYEGEVTGWEIAGSMNFALMETGVPRYYSTHVQLSKSEATAPPKNQAFIITSSTITASQIEALYSSWKTSANYGLTYNVQQVVFTLHFSDGTSSSKTLESQATATWNFKYSSPNVLSSVSVSWNITPYY